MAHSPTFPNVQPVRSCCLTLLLLCSQNMTQHIQTRSSCVTTTTTQNVPCWLLQSFTGSLTNRAVHVECRLITLLYSTSKHQSAWMVVIIMNEDHPRHHIHLNVFRVTQYGVACAPIGANQNCAGERGWSACILVYILSVAWIITFHLEWVSFSSPKGFAWLYFINSVTLHST